MRKLIRSLLLVLVLALSAIRGTYAADAVPAASDPVLEAKMIALANELRCLVCQNETLAASQASLAVDLKNQIREKIRAGESNETIIAYLVERYGDFVLYRPPLKGTTVLLWAGPFGLLIIAIGVLAYFVRRRREDPVIELNASEKARARQLLQNMDTSQ
jgi:cytochrome c-type biogenesis protein CcmH